MGFAAARFGPKVGQIGSKWDKSGTFLDPISVHNLLKADVKTGTKYTNLIKFRNLIDKITDNFIPY